MWYAYKGYHAWTVVSCDVYDTVCHLKIQCGDKFASFESRLVNK